MSVFHLRGLDRAAGTWQNMWLQPKHADRYQQAAGLMQGPAASARGSAWGSAAEPGSLGRKTPKAKAGKEGQNRVLGRRKWS